MEKETKVCDLYPLKRRIIAAIAANDVSLVLEHFLT